MPDGVLHVPARDIPVPTSVSPQAQAMLGGPAPTPAEYPAPGDVEGWRAHVATADEFMLGMLEAGRARLATEVETRVVDGVTIYVAVPEGSDPDDRRTYLDIHGGALIMGGGEVCKRMAASTAARVGVPVCAVDYRMPPEHPYPAALDDCLAVYRKLIEAHRPEEVVVGGASAGGNLAAALLLRARDEGLPLPAAAVLMTPEVDLTESGDSFATNLGVDTVLGLLRPVNELYAGGHDLAHPYLSPLFGDFTTGFPPTLLTTGTRDLFLSNTVRMHRALRAAGVPAELHVLEAAPHGGFFGTAPEDRELDREIRAFVHRHLGG